MANDTLVEVCLGESQIALIFQYKEAGMGHLPTHLPAWNMEENPEGAEVACGHGAG